MVVFWRESRANTFITLRHIVYMYSVAQSCTTLCSPMDYSTRLLAHAISASTFFPSGVPFYPWGLPNPGSNTCLLVSSSLVGRFFIPNPSGEALETHHTLFTCGSVAYFRSPKLEGEFNEGGIFVCFVY